MFAPSNRMFYALEAVLTIAYEGAVQPVASRELAQRQNLSARYLEPILQKLVRAGVLTSVRGAQGGYVLKPDQNKRSLQEIFSILGEENPLPRATTAMGELILTPYAQQLQQQLTQALSDINIDSLCARARAADIPIASQPTNDFAI